MLNPGVKIYECRNRKGWTQAELAAKAGIAQANLSNIEKGKRDLTVSTLVRVAQALEVKPADLIEEDAPVKSFSPTRTQIETLAKAVIEPKMKTSSEVRELAELLRLILPGSGKSPAAGTQKIQQAWTELRRRLSLEAIRGICRRIEDARQRTYA